MSQRLAYHEDASSMGPYMKPRPKRMVSLIFFRRAIYKPHNNSIGREKIATSNSMFIMASARMVAEVEPQVLGRRGFQFLAKGRHKRASWRIVPIPKHTTIAAKVKTVFRKKLLIPNIVL